MSAPISNYLAHLETLLADPLHVARSAASAGAPVVGYIGDDIPVALIAAAGAIPVALRADPCGATARADQILESAFHPALRGIAELWLNGELDFLKSVVFARSDDSAQRLYYYLCELQRRGSGGAPRPLLYDIARIARHTSVVHCRDSTQRLATELGAREDAFPAALRRVSRRESLLADVSARRATAAPLPGSLAWRIAQAAASDWRETFDDATRTWLAGAPTLSRPLRIVLAGDAPPDDALHRAIEDCGGSVVLELAGSVAGSSAESLSPLDALADQFHARRSPVLAMREDPEWTTRCARLVQADAVVFWLIEEDEALPWEISRQMRILREQGLPVLLLSRQRWVADERALQQVREFVNGPEVRK